MGIFKFLIQSLEFYALFVSIDFYQIEI